MNGPMSDERIGSKWDEDRMKKELSAVIDLARNLISVDLIGETQPMMYPHLTRVLSDLIRNFITIRMESEIMSRLESIRQDKYELPKNKALEIDFPKPPNVPDFFR